MRIQTEIIDEAAENLDQRDSEYLTALSNQFKTCEWISDEINGIICNEAKAREISLRDAFQTLYWIVLGQDFGPKLASILAEMKREDVVNLLELAISTV